MHYVNTNNGKDLPGYYLVTFVTEVKDDTSGDNLRDCEPHVMLKVLVEILVIVTKITPPGVVVRITVTKHSYIIQDKTRAPHTVPMQGPSFYLKT